jgi:uncharacterized protein YhaN
VDVRRDDLIRGAGDQVRRRSERLATVEEEIRHAQAEALGRTGERLQRILDQLGMLDLRLDALLAGGAVDTADAAHLADRIRSGTEARNRLRDEATRVRHHLIIQREALGLARQTPVVQCYPVPGRRRLPARATDP